MYILTILHTFQNTDYAPLYNTYRNNLKQQTAGSNVLFVTYCLTFRKKVTTFVLLQIAVILCEVLNSLKNQLKLYL